MEFLDPGYKRLKLYIVKLLVTEFYQLAYQQSIRVPIYHTPTKNVYLNFSLFTNLTFPFKNTGGVS